MNSIEVLKDTLKLFEHGYYIWEGKEKAFKTTKEQRAETVVLLPDEVDEISKNLKSDNPFVIGRVGVRVRNMDSFEMAQDQYKGLSYTFYKARKNILVLNFANPVNPGGGVRRGARAQEEDLCRRSSLLFSLESEAAKSYYQYHVSLHTYMGSESMILTPHVEVVKNSQYECLEDTFTVAVLTCAAPMITYGIEGMTEAEYEEMFYQRMVKMLHVAIHFGYDHLVLGAWGCGAFRNDAQLVSNLFYKALKELRVPLQKGIGTVKDFFRVIDFAVLDRTAAKYNLQAFQRNFGNFYREEDEAEREIVKRQLKNKEVAMDAIRGSLIGGAAGDALGYPVEFMSLSSIQKAFPEGKITSYKVNPMEGTAVVSDDTQMTLFTANGILIGNTRGALRGIMAAPSHYVWNCYQDWLITQRYETVPKEYKACSWLMEVQELYVRRAPGNTCMSAISGGVRGTMEKPVNGSKGCGGVMRVAPIALFYSKNVDWIDKEGAAVAALTHGHPLGYLPAAVLTHIVNRIVYAKNEYESMKAIILEAMETVSVLFQDLRETEALNELLMKAVWLAENDDSDEMNIRKLGEGWVAEEALAIAVYCSLRYENDFSEGIIAAVNHDGDSDSTGAITGNILGAWLGYSSIDDKWKKDLEMRDVILEMADDLCHGCAMSEYSSYEDPVWMAKYVYHTRKPSNGIDF